MRRSIVTCAPQFSMRRMVKEYTERLYLPALETGTSAEAEGYTSARALAEWKRRVRENWFTVNLQGIQALPAQASVGDALEIRARLWPGRLSAEDLAVEVVVGEDAGNDFAVSPVVVAMREMGRHGDGGIDYAATLSPAESGRVAVGVRVRPQHPAMIHPYELGLVRWV